LSKYTKKSALLTVSYF